jgi:hypothetical protein
VSTPKQSRTKKTYRDAPLAPEPVVLDKDFDGPSEADREWSNWRFQNRERERNE